MASDTVLAENQTTNESPPAAGSVLSARHDIEMSDAESSRENNVQSNEPEVEEEFLDLSARVRGHLPDNNAETKTQSVVEPSQNEPSEEDNPEDPSGDEAHENKSHRVPYHPEFIMQAIGATIGLGLIIPALIRNEPPSNISSSYASMDLEETLPDGIIAIEGLLLMVGSYAAFYSACGSALHIGYNAVKTFPYDGDVKKYLNKVGLRNILHIAGSLLGVSLAGVFLYYNITDPEAIYQLPFDSQIGVPDLFLQINSVPYFIGASANLFAYGSSGSSDVVRQYRDVISEVWTNLKDIFTTCGLRVRYVKKATSEDPANQNSDKEVKFDLSFHNLLLSIGGIVGIGYGIPLLINIQEENVSLAGAGPTLSQKLPLDFWRILAPVLVVSIIANFYAGIGATIDILIDAYKKFPKHKTWDNLKKYYSELDVSGGLSHIIGTSYGLAIAILYLINNAKDPEATFALPFGAQIGVPLILLQAGAPFYVMGSRGNLASYAVSGLTYAAKYAYQLVGDTFTKGKSLLSKCGFFKPKPSAEPSIPRDEHVPQMRFFASGSDAI